jgi:antitoxin component of MazEF toxin-antitoxin module
MKRKYEYFLEVEEEIDEDGIIICRPSIREELDDMLGRMDFFYFVGT